MVEANKLRGILELLKSARNHISDAIGEMIDAIAKGNKASHIFLIIVIKLFTWTSVIFFTPFSCKTFNTKRAMHYPIQYLHHLVHHQ